MRFFCDLVRLRSVEAGLRFLVLATLASPAARAETTWTIDAARPADTSKTKHPTDAVAPTAPSSAPQNSPSALPPKPLKISELYHARVTEPMSEEDIAAAFGHSLRDGMKTRRPATGEVRHFLVTDLIREAMPRVADLMRSYSKCGGRELIVAQSSFARPRGRLVIGLHETCQKKCLAVLDLVAQNGDILETSNQYTVDPRLCGAVIGGAP
jgi:hypothetical protein